MADKQKINPYQQQLDEMNAAYENPTSYGMSRQQLDAFEAANKGKTLPEVTANWEAMKQLAQNRNQQFMSTGVGNYNIGAPGNLPVVYDQALPASAQVINRDISVESSPSLSATIAPMQTGVSQADIDAIRQQQMKSPQGVSSSFSAEVGGDLNQNVNNYVASLNSVIQGELAKYNDVYKQLVDYNNQQNADTRRQNLFLTTGGIGGLQGKALNEMRSNLGFGVTTGLGDVVGLGQEAPPPPYNPGQAIHQFLSPHAAQFNREETQVSKPYAPERGLGSQITQAPIPYTALVYNPGTHAMEQIPIGPHGLAESQTHNLNIGGSAHAAESVTHNLSQNYTNWKDWVDKKEYANYMTGKKNLTLRQSLNTVIEDEFKPSGWFGKNSILKNAVIKAPDGNWVFNPSFLYGDPNRDKTWGAQNGDELSKVKPYQLYFGKDAKGNLTILHDASGQAIATNANAQQKLQEVIQGLTQKLLKANPQLLNRGVDNKGQGYVPGKTALRGKDMIDNHTYLTWYHYINGMLQGAFEER